MVDGKLNLRYTEAESKCASLGAHLVTPRTAEESACATDVAGSSAVWLGFRGGRTEESFVGADGRGPITYTNWRDGEPNLLSDGDNCVAHWPSTRYGGHWLDFSCGNEQKTMCQMKDWYRPQCD